MLADAFQRNRALDRVNDRLEDAVLGGFKRAKERRETRWRKAQVSGAVLSGLGALVSAAAAVISVLS